MYLFFTDETSLQPGRRARFFIYGGIFFAAQRVNDLHDLVQSARNENGFREGDPFKFASNSRPSHVTPAQHKRAKRTVLEGCVDVDVRFVACLVLHELAWRRSQRELVSWGANTVIGAFEKFLEEERTSGVCMIDRIPFDHPYSYLQEKFQRGLLFPGGRTRRLHRIKAFGFTCDGASHASSAVDIVLGSFRYCVNASENTEAARRMFPRVMQVMWHKRRGNKIFFREYGLYLRPRNVGVQEHRDEYDRLLTRLSNLL